MKKLLVFALVLAATAVFGITQLNADATSKARDNDCNAVMYGGALTKSEFAKKLKAGDNGKGCKHSSSNLKAVYKTYGIDTSLSGAKNGKVYKDGRIVVDGKTVATNAWSVGRHNFGKSTKVSSNGVTTYKRATSTSFVTGSIDAWVMFNKDGTFKNAVLKSCGNPVGGKNKVPKKSAKCDNLTSKKINRTKFEFTAKASVKNGAKIQGYRIDFGDGHAQYYKTGSKSKTVSHTYAKPGTYKVKMTVNTDVGDYVTSSNCATTVKVEQPPKPPKVELPVVSCDALEVKKNSRTSYDFTVKATAKNTKVTAYTFDFGDGKTSTVKTDATTKTVSHNYAKEGKYTVQVTLTTLDKQVKDKKCSATVDVAKAPVATCDGLEAKVTDRTHYELTARASAANGASIKNYTFVVTDENGKTVVNETTSKTTLSGELTPGTYKAKVTVHTSLGDKTSENCATEFTIVKPNEIQVCDLETKEVVTINEEDFDETKHSKNLEDCKEVPVKIEVCDLDTKEIVTIDEKDFDESKYSKNLNDCKEVPTEKVKVCDTDTGKIVTVDEKDLNDSRYSKDLSDCDTPDELPETGAGGISAALGLGSIVTAVTYYVASRRNLLSSLLGR